MADLPVMGKAEPSVTEDPEITMEDIFGDLDLEGQQTSMPPGAAKRRESSQRRPWSRKSL